MATTMERREHHRRPSPARSISPKRNHSSSHRREKEKSPAQRREKISDRSYDRERNRGGDKEKDRARERRDGSDRGSNRERERVKERDDKTKPIEKESVRSSERNREKEDARDESPRTKRLRRAQEERESERIQQRESRKEMRDEKMEERKYVKMEERGSRKEREYEKMEERGSRKERGYEREKNGREERESRRRGSRSPAGRIEKSESRDEVQNARGDSIPRSGDHDSLAQMNAAAQELEAKEKQKPSFELSGKLAEETNKVRGVTLLFTEPQEARKPDIRWRLYVFKGGEVLNEPLYVHRQSCYLFGRERRVADIPTDHPSCSKQHAVLQYRLVEKEQPDGMMKQVVRPYLMDLESTNGSFINDNRLEARRYYELFEKDTIKFGNSSREYVLLHENSTTT